MKIARKLSTISAATLLSAGLLATALAADRTELSFASEVDTCLSAVNANVDLSNATRVRHVVKQQQHAGSAYAFAIATTVFAKNRETHYAAYCVASGAGEPAKFRISEKPI